VEAITCWKSNKLHFLVKRITESHWLCMLKSNIINFSLTKEVTSHRLFRAIQLFYIFLIGSTLICIVLITDAWMICIVLITDTWMICIVLVTDAWTICIVLITDAWIIQASVINTIQINQSRKCTLPGFNERNQKICAYFLIISTQYIRYRKLTVVNC
jgi:hypothetical protein